MFLGLLVFLVRALFILICLFHLVHLINSKLSVFQSMHLSVYLLFLYILILLFFPSTLFLLSHERTYGGNTVVCGGLSQLWRRRAVQISLWFITNLELFKKRHKKPSIYDKLRGFIFVKHCESSFDPEMRFIENAQPWSNLNWSKAASKTPKIGTCQNNHPA